MFPKHTNGSGWLPERGYSIFAVPVADGSMRWISYSTCHVGCSWAAYWWARVIGVAHQLLLLSASILLCLAAAVNLLLTCRLTKHSIGLVEKSILPRCPKPSCWRKSRCACWRLYAPYAISARKWAGKSWSTQLGCFVGSLVV